MKAILLAMLKSGTGQVMALLCAAVSVKILAVVGGPAGVGLYSLLRQIQQTLCAVASMGGQNAVVQGVASRHGHKRDEFVVSVLVAIVAGVAVVTVFTAVLAKPIAALLLANDDSGPRLIGWILLPVIAGSLLIVFRGLLNGYMAIGAVAWVNVAAAVGSVFLAFPAAKAYNAGHEAALVALLGGSLGGGLIFALYYAWARGCLAALGSSAARVNPVAIGQFLRVALPSLVAMFIGMGGVLAVRAAVVHWHGLTFAGHFDAAWSISLTFVIVFLTSLQTYLLPALSDRRSDEEWREVLSRALRLSIIIAVPLLTTLIVMKPFIVRLLYSGEFVHALELLRWTLLGDYIRVVGWVLATTLVARADMRAYLGSEIVWNVVFVAAALWLVRGGIGGAGPAYVGAYVLYLAILLWRIMRRHAIVIRTYAMIEWSVGACVVVCAGVLTWNDTSLDAIKLVLIPLSALFSALCMTRLERQAAYGVGMRMLQRMRVAASKIF